MGIQVVTGPTADPINLAEAKLHLRATYTDDDLMIKMLIRRAAEYAQDYTQKRFVSSVVKMVFDSFPYGDGLCAPIFNRVHARPTNALELERGPVNSVVSINYTDQSNTPQVVDPTTYIVDYSSDPVRITPVFGQVWPIAIEQIGCVSVTCMIGYAAPLTVNFGAHTIQPSNWPALVVGQPVRLTNSGGALPTLLADETTYFVQAVVSPGVYTLSATLGGGVLAFTDNGTGTSFLGEVPESAKGWMLLRIGGMYENREDIASSMLAPLPYLDRLLDALKTWRF